MTDEIFYKDELNEKRISAYKKLAENYRVQEGTVRDIFSQGIAFAVSHTATHTAGLEAKYNEAYSSAAKYAEESVRLRERVKELEAELETWRELSEAAKSLSGS